jgi:hypothetical protein
VRAGFYLKKGLHIAIDTNGEVCRGANQAGPKLYTSQKVAEKKAGLGGSVYRIRAVATGLIVEQLTGPVVTHLEMEHITSED